MSLDQLLIDSQRELIAAQAERIQELHEALIDIRNRILCPVGPSPSLDEVGEIASAALVKADGDA